MQGGQSGVLNLCMVDFYRYTYRYNLFLWRWWSIRRYEIGGGTDQSDWEVACLNPFVVLNLQLNEDFNQHHCRRMVNTRILNKPGIILELKIKRSGLNIFKYNLSTQLTRTYGG